jgi:two-component system LytT family response regulator
MKVKALLVEDNPFMATILSDLLQENHPEVEILGVAENGYEGLKKINQLQPDLVFLDIEMPDMNGFEMLREIGEINFQTIFITAHSHYAIKAFRFNALDYLVKPVNAEHLNQSIKRFKSNRSTNAYQMQQALVNLSTENIEEQKLVLATEKGILHLPLKNIIKIESERNYSFIHLSDRKKELSSKTLSHFESILSDKGFFRCHRSFLVNRYHIDSVGQDSFNLKDSSKVPISRRKKSEVKKWFYTK